MNEKKSLILMVEDEEQVLNTNCRMLRRRGYDVHTAQTAAEACHQLEEHLPDLLILDIMLPDGNGLEVLQSVKDRYPSVCCIMLSALGQEGDKVTGLNLGADDYISKPFGVMELVARVNAALRRRAGNNVIRIGKLELNSDTMTVTLDSRPLDLNRKEFELLKYCMKNADIVLSRDTLLTEIWGYVDTETRTLDNHIARLRKLGIDNFETVFGVGYRFRKN